MINRIKKIKYTLIHRKCYIDMYKTLRNIVPRRVFWHDLDKILLYLLPLPMKWLTAIHRFYSQHHVPNKWRKTFHVFDAFVDWECARYTKEDKPLSAVQTAERYYPDYVDQMKEWEAYCIYDLRIFDRKYGGNYGIKS